MTQTDTRDPGILLELASLHCQCGDKYYQQYLRSKDRAHFDKASEDYNVAFALLCRYADLMRTEQENDDQSQYKDTNDE